MTENVRDFANSDLEEIVESDPAEETAAQIEEYDLTSAPNDFNVTTIYSFIESGAVKVPAFQRNYVWDIKRASRLIESLIIGLPVPQAFLYEQGRNNFLVVDGQQRLMTIYYFMKGRFPRANKRAELRRVFTQHGEIPQQYLNDNDFFELFRLRLPEVKEGVPNKFNGLTYATLDEYATQFNLRTIRNIIVKQVKPSEDNSSIYEMFNRLNTGGTLLMPQEIRTSLYHSEALNQLTRINDDPRWRKLINTEQPDVHMRDVEVLLRSIAVWRNGGNYQPSMARFLNSFAGSMQAYGDAERSEIEGAFDWFLNAISDDVAADMRSENGRLVVSLFEAVFSALVERRRQNGDFAVPPTYVSSLIVDEAFREASDVRPTDRANVRNRREIARKTLADALSEN